MKILGYNITIQKEIKRDRNVILKEIENNVLQAKQDFEDASYIRDAKFEAFEMFNQWLDGQNTPTAKLIKERFNIIEVPVMCVPKPRRYLYHIYTKPNYDLDYNKIKVEEFNRLKKEYNERK